MVPYDLPIINIDFDHSGCLMSKHRNEIIKNLIAINCVGSMDHEIILEGNSQP